MRSTFLMNKWFCIPYLIAILAGSFFLVKFTKSDIHLFINQYHSAFFDSFFKYITNLGDGICLPLFLVIMLLIRFRDSILLVVVFLLSGLFVQILKRLFFSDVARPSKYFEGNHTLHYIPGVEQLCCNSFPSGHSATAFSVFFVFAMVTKHRWLKCILFILACLVAFSRVYLSQHFIVDIMAGSFIGMLTVFFCYPMIQSFKKDWLNKNIQTFIIKSN
jgi:membrane-associated phospholipid phosphatase